MKRCVCVTEVRKWRGKSGRDKGGEKSYTRAKHGKAISVQPRFLVPAKGIFAARRGGIYMRVCVTSVKKDELSMNRFGAHDSSGFCLIANYSTASYSLSTLSVKLDELVYTDRPLSISLSLMIIKAWHDEISLMEDNIPSMVSYYYSIFRVILV